MKFPAARARASRSLGKKLILLALASTLSATAPAGPLEELRSISLLPDLDLARLKAGNIISERAPLGEFERGIHLEVCYFVRAPMDAVGSALLHWDPVEHRDPEVRLYQEYPLSGAPGAFKRLQLDPGFAGDKWLLDQTARVARTGKAGELHLTSEEVALLREKAKSPSEAWQEIMRRRSEALTRGGLAAVPPYGADKAISPLSELRGLLSLAPKAARHFEPITQGQPIVAGGNPASDSVGYWEATRVRDHTTLLLALFAAQKSPGSWQLVNCIYYPSDTYFMALQLIQLWPVEGGTLVWQVDFVSAPFRPYLGGVDRFIAGKQMSDETLSTIETFRAHLERR